MTHPEMTLTGAVVAALAVALVLPARAQDAAERFTATAAVKTAGAAEANAPVTIIVSRKMSQAEADRLTAAFATGGPSALRAALVGVAATGSIQLGGAAPTPTRMTLERVTDKGRLLTMLADRPILALGAGLAGAKPTEGHDFAVLDLEVDSNGSGAGMLAPAAKVRINQGVFVVQDYAAEVVRLTDVKKVK